MSKRRKRKPSVLRHKFTVGMQKKLVMLFIAILLAFVILVGRITYINASSGEDYTKTVLDQQQYMRVDSVQAWRYCRHKRHKACDK